MSGEHRRPVHIRKALPQHGTKQAERVLMDKLRRLREGLSQGGRYRPDEIELQVRMFEVMLRGERK
jgi:hypothetical protein